MSQIDTTPPADFHPQDESVPTFDWDDTQTIPPVPNLYLPNDKPVHIAPTERFTTATYLLDTATPVKVVNKSEPGIGCRVTLSMFQLGANVAIAPTREALGTLFTPAAPLGVFYPGAFIMPAGIGAAGISTTLWLTTCAEIWAIALTNANGAVAWLSVLQEQFYGD